MNDKIKLTLEKFSNNSYALIFEGICVGVITGVLVTLFRLALEQAESMRGDVLTMASQTVGYAVMALAILAVCYLGVCYCYRKQPLCSGSGIPQVKGELKGQISQNWWQIIIAKFAGGVMAIGAGMSMGREGPSIQLGAMVGKGFSRFAKKLRTEEKMLMTCGAGAGLAGAFGAPLAGAVFALEELHKNFSTDVMVSTLAASVASDFVVSYMFDMKPVFDLNVAGGLPLQRYWMILILGIILGAFGRLYNKATEMMQDLYDKMPRKFMKIAVPFGFIIVFALILPEVLGSGHELASQAAAGSYGLKMLAVILIAKFAFSIISFASGAPGGIFLPLLVLGAVTGAMYGRLVGGLIGFEELYLPNFVILGMVGYFSAIVRAPITGVILITEMTGDFKNFLSLAIVALVAYVAADILNGKPIYDQLLYRMMSKDADYGTTEETGAHKVLVESDVYMGSLMDGEKIEKMLLPPGCLVVSVQRDNREIVPGGGTVLKGGDKLTLLCSEAFVNEVDEKLNNICRKIRQ